MFCVVKEILCALNLIGSIFLMLMICSLKNRRIWYFKWHQWPCEVSSTGLHWWKFQSCRKYYWMLYIRFQLLILACSMVYAVCPNYNVVVFQPRTGINPYLRSVAIFTTFLDSSRPTYFNRFCISHFLPRTWLLLLPCISPVNVTSLSCFTRFFSP